MSGGAEANFELGWSVNLDSHVSLLKTTHAHAKSTQTKPLYVFVSSLAIYGGPKCLPESYVVPADTPPLPQTSYGIQKHIMEMYVYDYGRKGYLDTRAVRLPTVAIRSGAVSHPYLKILIVSEVVGVDVKPSSAASSFISGLIREPLQGQRATCPIADSEEDEVMDKMPFYVSRSKTVTRNIAWAMCMPESNFVQGQGRTINIPGIKITPRQIVQAL